MIAAFTGKYAFLSNFSPHQVRLSLYGRDCFFKTAEHAFQAAKAIKPEDAQAVMEAPTPGEAKKIGRRVKCRADWDLVRKRVMITILLDKFRGDLRTRLLQTGAEVLVEGNTWRDTFWGAVPRQDGIPHQDEMVVRCATEGPAQRRMPHALPQWVADDGTVFAGHNWLGRELMMVRDIVGETA